MNVSGSFYALPCHPRPFAVWLQPASPLQDSSLKNQWFAPMMLEQLCALTSQGFPVQCPWFRVSHPHPPALNWELVSTSKPVTPIFMKLFLLFPLVSSHPHLSPSSPTYDGGCSVAKSSPILCGPMDCSKPGFPVLHYLLEFAQIQVHCVGKAIQPSHPLLPASLPALSFPASGSLSISWLFASGGWSTGVSASPSALPLIIQGWFTLGLTGLISLLSTGISKESSPAPQFESINSLALSLLSGPTLTSIHDYWKNHSFD